MKYTTAVLSNFTATQTFHKSFQVHFPYKKQLVQAFKYSHHQSILEPELNMIYTLKRDFNSSQAANKKKNLERE